RLDPAQQSREAQSFHVVARLKPSVSLEQARAEMEAIAGSLEQEHPNTNKGKGVNLVSLNDQIVSQFRPAFFTLAGVVGFVLLIACVNVAGLLITRAVGRQKEIAIRVALGASRRRLIQLFFMESFLLSAVGGAIGLLVTSWGIDLLRA